MNTVPIISNILDHYGLFDNELPIVSSFFGMFVDVLDYDYDTPLRIDFDLSDDSSFSNIIDSTEIFYSNWNGQIDTWTPSIDPVDGQQYWVRTRVTDGYEYSSYKEETLLINMLNYAPGADIPEVFALHQNYPNPFNPITSLRYDLPEDGLVNITIYDMMGRIVKTLINSSQSAGYKSIQWNATNDRNKPVSAGLYLYTIQAGEFRQTKKMVLLK